MNKLSPKQIWAACTVFFNLLLSLVDADSEKLQAFIVDPDEKHPLRKVIVNMFTKVGDTVQKNPNLLKYIHICLLFKVSKFVARDKFVVSTSETAELKISYLGDNFQKHFLGKTEKDVEVCEMKTFSLLKSSHDEAILNELGSRAEIALAHVYEFLKSAKKNMRCIFYVKDVNGVLWAVYVYWCDDGWGVDARSVEYPYDWDGGYMVLSR